MTVSLAALDSEVAKVVSPAAMSEAAIVAAADFEASGRLSVGDEVPPRDLVDDRLAATTGSNMNNNRLYVGNLAFDTTDEALKRAFADCGEVLETKVVSDRETGRSRGFGFVVMATPEAAQTAISRMNGAEVDGRPLRVNEATDRPRRSDGVRSGPDGDRRRRW